MWSEIAQTLVAEFSDLAQPTEMVRVILRLVVAAALGGVLGFDRERHGKAAGVRTHMLVAIGSALFILLAQQSGISGAERSRVLQGLITGVGFLGAGAIIKGSHDEHIQGLTTATGIWLTAAIGVAAGMGREATAILSTILALIVLAIIPKITR